MEKTQKWIEKVKNVNEAVKNGATLQAAIKNEKFGVGTYYKTCREQGIENVARPKSRQSKRAPHVKHRKTTPTTMSFSEFNAAIIAVNALPHTLRSHAFKGLYVELTKGR